MKKRAKKKAAKKASKIRLKQMILQAIEESEESVQSIAEQCGVSKSQIFRFIKDERDLRFEAAAKLCEVLGLTLVRDDKMKASSESAASDETK